MVLGVIDLGSNAPHTGQAHFGCKEKLEWQLGGSFIAFPNTCERGNQRCMGGKGGWGWVSRLAVPLQPYPDPDPTQKGHIFLGGSVPHLAKAKCTIHMPQSAMFKAWSNIKECS